MKPHKEYQRYYNSLRNYDDSLDHIPYVVENDLQTMIQRVIEYFTTPTETVSYPAKSYAVALIYAHLLEKHFGDDFMASLNDPDLLCGNDLYYKTYAQSSHVYEMIFEHVPINKSNYELPLQLPQVKKTQQYFMLEFNVS